MRPAIQSVGLFETRTRRVKEKNELRSCRFSLNCLFAIFNNNFFSFNTRKYETVKDFDIKIENRKLRKEFFSADPAIN